MSDVSSGTPLFILSHARTGSTLLRYVVDAHPEVCCPPELALGRLCEALTYTINLTLDGPATAADRPERVRRAVREYVDGMMGAYCASKGKVRWCDKSTNNVEHLPTLTSIFPDAQFICLHRNGLDVVHSLLELFRYGFPGRFGQIVAQSPHNTVDAMIASWVEATRELLSFEAAHPGRCLRVTYESLVASPAATAARLCAFLNVRHDPGLIDRVFSAPHDAGPGDLKIQFTSKILRNRVGKGATLPRRHASRERLSELNECHAALGYPPVAAEDGVEIENVLSAAAAVSSRVERERWG